MFNKKEKFINALIDKLADMEDLYRETSAKCAELIRENKELKRQLEERT